MTVLEIIQRSAEFLTKKGVDSPRLQAELLLADVLELPRMELYMKFERALTSTETDRFREMIRRRGQREPLQYILHSTSFCGLEIAVNPRVLIPRPETELLAERGWKFLHQQSTSAPAPFPGSGPNVPSSTALEFGTGSGCLAIALAVNCTHAQIIALEICSEALELARQNATSLGVAERIHFVQSDGFLAVRDNLHFDLIISNPPYIPTQEIEKLQAEVRDYEPRGALDGGLDGLDYFRRLAVEAGPLLKPGGRLMMEFGDGQATAIREILEAQKWVVEAIDADYTQRPRIIIAKHSNS